jgi:hypothetical protein
MGFQKSMETPHSDPSFRYRVYLPCVSGEVEEEGERERERLEIRAHMLKVADE